MSSPDAAVADALVMVRAGLAALAEVEVSALAPEVVAEVAIELAQVEGVVGAELARFAAAVADRGVWADDGAASPFAWLSSRTGMGWGAARRSVELGAAMAQVPELDAAVRSGDVSPGAAAVVLRAIEDEGFGDVAGPLIAELAGLTPAKARRHVEEWRALFDPIEESERRRRAEDERCLVFRPLPNGMTHVEGVVSSSVARQPRAAACSRT